MRWKDKSRLWTADEIRRARAAFWDTRLTYGGQKETWDVLKFVCDELQRMKAAQGRLDEVTILATCQTSLDAAGINLPDGYLCHDVFDESGFRYEIPMYIVCDPDNVVPEGGSSANSTNDDDYDSRGILSNARRSAQLSSAAADEEKINVMTIKCRFSDTTNDVEVDTFPITGNARDLLKRLKKLRPAVGLMSTNIFTRHTNCPIGEQRAHTLLLRKASREEPDHCRPRLPAKQRHQRLRCPISQLNVDLFLYS